MTRLWKIVHPDVPFCFFIATSAEDAKRKFFDGVAEEHIQQYNDLHVSLLALDDILVAMLEEEEEGATLNYLIEF